jgi:D-alanine-D-alanine ligase
LAGENTVVILYNEVPKDAAPDEADTKVQADLVANALEKLGFKTILLPFSLHFSRFIDNLSFLAPVFVFNLVESVDGEGRLNHLAPLLLEHMQIRYTGSPAEAIYLTTNKVLTKKLLHLKGVATPRWVSLNEAEAFNPGIRYLIKPISEDASIGLDGDCLFKAEDSAELKEFLSLKQKMTGKEFFAEEYIDGREFNISIIGLGGEPEILPPAEIKFTGLWENGRAKIVDYKAKWDESSFEYQNTQRIFEFGERDRLVLDHLKTIAKLCWKAYNLKGYARLDFRVDQSGKPWLLEINANPCLTPGSGFMAAAEVMGLTFTDVIARIIKEI